MKTTTTHKYAIHTQLAAVVAGAVLILAFRFASDSTRGKAYKFVEGMLSLATAKR